VPTSGRGTPKPATDKSTPASPAKPYWPLRACLRTP